MLISFGTGSIKASMYTPYSVTRYYKFKKIPPCFQDICKYFIYVFKTNTKKRKIQKRFKYQKQLFPFCLIEKTLGKNVQNS